MHQIYKQKNVSILVKTLKVFVFSILIIISSNGLLPVLVSADTTGGDSSYTMLAKDTPLSDASGKTDINSFLPNLFKLAIGVAGALAVIYIIVGGIQYLSTDAINNKEDGKGKISNAIWGLLLALSAYVILNTVNPRLLNFDLTVQPLPQAGAIDSGIGQLGTGSGSTTPIATGCSDCVPVTGIPSKPPADKVGGCASNATINPAGVCVVAPKMYEDLKKITASMNVRSWQVTEMYPPTVDHHDPCHRNGTCVDATVTVKDDASLKFFFQAIQNSGASSYEYEVCGDLTRLNDLNSKKSTVFSGLTVKFACETTTTGSVNSSGKVSESVHINQ